MGDFESLEEAREYFGKDRFASDAGVILEELYEDGCVCSLTLNDSHKNAYGGVMGGVMFTLADFAFAVTTNDKERRCVAQQVSINYLSAPKGSRLIARAKCRKDGRTSNVVNVDISDDTGRDIAQFVGTGFKLN
ncbi:MAG: PaaI family thioesterase [Lachnospiraceae bacterium]|nr:PaaI family thioesterase [Lachnospiraceae bacterium]